MQLFLIKNELDLNIVTWKNGIVYYMWKRKHISDEKCMVSLFYRKVVENLDMFRQINISRNIHLTSVTDTSEIMRLKEGS